MESEQHSQTSPPKLDDRRLQWAPHANSSQPDDGDEGGLNLGQVVSAILRRLPVIAGVTTVVASAAMLKAVTSTATYQASFEILTKPITVESQVISSVPETLSNKEQQDTPTKEIDQTKLKLLKSPKILAPIVKQLKKKYSDITYDELATKLVVLPLPSSEILSISYQDKKAEKVKDVLNLVSETYLRYSLEERLSDVRQGIDFVSTQLPKLQKRVELVQDRLQSFRQQYNLIDPESASKQLAEQTGVIGQQRLETQVKLNEARAIELDLQSQRSRKGSESIASSALGENSRYQSLLNQLLEVESQIAKESTLFREDTANIQVLRDQQKNLLPLLQREGERVEESVASKIRDLEARNQILIQTESGLNQRIKQLSVISRQYADIQQDLKIAAENLNQFLAKREALRIDAGQKKAPWQVLTPPTEPTPSSADVKRTTALGVILGLLLGVGAALLLDRISNVLHSVEQVKESSKLPILGVIPFNAGLKEQEQLTSVADITGLIQQMQKRFGFENGTKSDYAGSPFLEAFRSLYTNIQLLSSDTQIRSFVISSSVPGEGKSTVAIHLAQAAAALGQRVLLVDTDLRLPQIHNRLELLNSYGLSNLIALDMEIEEVVQRSLLDENLYVITAGQVPPDPTKLLSSQKMQKLINQFKELYDLVIYDMPPLLGLADTKLVASKTDGIIMVLGLGKTKNSVFSKAMEELKAFPGMVLGLVANGSKEQASSLYNSYNRYHAPPKKNRQLPEKVTPVAINQTRE